jgi:hypothetical protein
MECRMLLRVLAATLALGLVAGCGGSGESGVETVAVSGTVYLDDNPLAGCAVHFIHSDKYVGIGQTDSSGKYELKAEPGENTVLFFKSKDSGLTEEEQEMEDMAGTEIGEEGEEDAEGGEEGQLIPARYGDADQTDQKFNVPAEGATDADFKLSGQ